MKIVIAPDSFKESLTALEAAEVIASAFQSVFPQAECVRVPMADGGEGTVQSIVDAVGGEMVTTTVTAPLGDSVTAGFGLLEANKTAVIEMAAASGIHLVPPDQRNPLLTSSRGTGELIRHALDWGARHIILAIGGSATNDGGAGMMQALGARLLTASGEPVGPGGGALADLARIDLTELDERLADVMVEVACDVSNPLCGETGASAIFGPQKGATAEMIEVLDANLNHYAEIIQRDLGKQVRDVPGAGAAGGLGAACLGFLGGELKRGVDIVISATRLRDHFEGADLVITGEGRIDGQSIYGKTPVGVALAAKEKGLPVIGIAGCLTDDASAVYEHGIDALFDIVPTSQTLETALVDAGNNLFRASVNIARLLKLSGGIQTGQV